MCVLGVGGGRGQNYYQFICGLAKIVMLLLSAEKTKLMTNSSNGIKREIKAKGQKLGMVISFK